MAAYNTPRYSLSYPLGPSSERRPSGGRAPDGRGSWLPSVLGSRAKQLDVVLMNREAYDIYSRNGYLLELDMI